MKFDIGDLVSWVEVEIKGVDGISAHYVSKLPIKEYENVVVCGLIIDVNFMTYYGGKKLYLIKKLTSSLTKMIEEDKLTLLSKANQQQ